MLGTKLRPQLGCRLDELKVRGARRPRERGRSFDQALGVSFRPVRRTCDERRDDRRVRSMAEFRSRVPAPSRRFEAGDRLSEGVAERRNRRRAQSRADHRLTGYLAGHRGPRWPRRSATSGATRRRRTCATRRSRAEEQLGQHQLSRRCRRRREATDAEKTFAQAHYSTESTFDEAAKELGLSKSWASRLHRPPRSKASARIERRRSAA